MSLEFEQRGQTWVCRELEPAWPMSLIARHVYYGTARMPLTLTLARDGGKKGSTTILTSHLDLLIAGQRRAYAKEAALRLHQVVESSDEKLQQSVTTMVDALLERLQAAQDEVTVMSVADVKLPENLAPKYVLWPLVPASRPGMLVAPSMTGKSMTATMVALTLTTEHLFVPALEPRDPGAVLYVAQEEAIDQFAARVALICKGHGIEVPKHLHVIRLRSGSLVDSAELLAEMASTRHAKLIVIDSAQACWGAGGDNVREYATRWYNAIDQLECPTLIIEHPNLEGTRKPGQDLLAAGTSVKRDRVGHAWQLKSVSIPPGPDDPWRYHVTLSDTKRNYVAKQDDITYEVQIFRHEWVRFSAADALTPDYIINSPTRVDRDVAKVLRDIPNGPWTEQVLGQDPNHAEGWKVGDIAKAIGAKDDKRIVEALKTDRWRHADWAPGIRYRFSQAVGTGGNPVLNPALWSIDVEKVPVEMPVPPGDDIRQS